MVILVIEIEGNKNNHQQGDNKMKATHPADILIANMENTEYNNRLTATRWDHWRTDRILTSDRRKSANDILHKEKKLAHIDADGTVTFYCDKFEAAASPFCFNIYDHQGFIIG